MRIWRSLQGKLFLTYSLIIIALIIIVSIPMYAYLKKDIERNVVGSVNESITSFKDKMDESVSQFDIISMQFYLNFDINGNTANKYLHDLIYNDANYDQFQAEKAINNFVALMGDIYTHNKRISVYTMEGKLFSNQPYQSDVNHAATFAHRLDPLLRSNGENIIRYEKQDYWSSKDQTPVFVISRLLNPLDDRIGVIEMQLTASEMIPTEKLNRFRGAALTIMDDNAIIYTTDPEYADQLFQYEKKLPKSTHDGVLPIKFRGDDLFYQTSAKTGLTYMISIPDKDLFAQLRFFRNVTVIAVIFLILFSVIVFYVLSRLLTLPLLRLRKAIDSINLEEDKRTGIINTLQMDEIESINRSFRRMHERLQHSLEEIVQFRTLQWKSHFNTLQAQINPHFLFNMLGTIHAIAENGEIQKVEYISRSLADFLRYSITSDSATATLQQEIEFTVNYLELMKFRYMHRLHFQLQIDPALNVVLLPKLTLQPLVENCIKHGFRDIKHALRIEIRGTIHEGRWELQVIDNGAGFAADNLESIQIKAQHYLDQVIAKTEGTPLSIGGMGLISAIARLNFLFKDQLRFSFGNNIEHGAFVTISGTINH